MSKQAVKLTKRRKIGTAIAQDLGIPFAKKITIGATISAIERAQQKRERKLQRQQHLMQCWERWQRRYQSPELAIAYALHFANRWIKGFGKQEVNPFNQRIYNVYSGKESHLRNQVYEIKEKWIEVNQDKLVKGQKVRFEMPNFDGFFDGYSKGRWLYSHIFDIDCVEFQFHSYLEPKHLSNELGTDLKSYGTPLSKAEIADIEISLDDLLGVIRVGMKQLTAR